MTASASSPAGASEPSPAAAAASRAAASVDPVAPPTPAPVPSASSERAGATTSGDQVYAIVEAAGQQFLLQPNRYFDLDRLDADVESTISLESVLLLKGAKGVTLGQPYVKGASVELKVLAHRRGPKILVYKMRRKKKTRRKTGHRQELTRVLVQSIQVGGKPFN